MRKCDCGNYIYNDIYKKCSVCMLRDAAKNFKDNICKIQKFGEATLAKYSCEKCGSFWAVRHYICPNCQQKNTVTEYKISKEKIKFLGGRPKRDKIINIDDIIEVNVQLNKINTIDDAIKILY